MSRRNNNAQAVDLSADVSVHSVWVNIIRVNDLRSPCLPSGEPPLEQQAPPRAELRPGDSASVGVAWTRQERDHWLLVAGQMAEAAGFERSRRSPAVQIGAVRLPKARKDLAQLGSAIHETVACQWDRSPPQA